MLRAMIAGKQKKWLVSVVKGEDSRAVEKMRARARVRAMMHLGLAHGDASSLRTRQLPLLSHVTHARVNTHEHAWESSEILLVVEPVT